MTEILLILLGFTVALVGTLAGGGGLIGMPALLFFQLPIHSVIATAKFANTISSFSSFYQLLRQKKIVWKQALFLIPFAAGGGMIGGLITNHISERIMTSIAIILLSGAFLLALVKKPSFEANSNWVLPKKILPILFLISIYDGMFGPGQVTLLMYTFLLSGASFMEAVAYSRFQTFISCFFAFTQYAISGNFIWTVGIFYAIGSLSGSIVAIRLAPKISMNILKKLLHFITIALIVSLCVQLFQ
ncbi:sulfite exporter TauE/SafE family protein [Bacillus massiliigorillae]|uniref:sulfite exporter TauE/SafE family protein n=1 Tax=Bacillus massiliigorillae TaxID=1243664 RepID=UPI00039A3B2A|nr:sulfite exporter TauE/SafE family protein [Bacillus massiliigorillae]